MQTSIRLLVLYSGSYNEILRCRLEERDITNAKGYDALSYAWGGQVATSCLLCDGDSLAITPSLEAALKALRPSQGTRLIWADGACINQNDLYERGHQVQHMQQIYSRATSVMIFLGSDDKGYALEAFRICKEIYQANKVRELDPILFPANTEFWIPVIKLFTCSWFGRLWVIQELVSSKTACVLWGKESVSWETLFISSNWLAKCNSYLRYKAPYLGVPMIMEGLRYFENTGSGPSFKGLIQVTWHYQCTDERDRIYALLGLPCKDVHIVKAIYPDYSLTKSQLYQKVARLVLLHDRSIDYLAEVYHIPTSRDGSELVLPSWCPQHRLRKPEDFCCPERPFAASRGLSSSQSLHYYRLSTLYPDTIWLKGFKYDTICLKAQRPAPVFLSDQALLRLILEWWTELVKKQIMDKEKLYDLFRPSRRENGFDPNLLFVDSIAAGTCLMQGLDRRAPLQLISNRLIQICRTLQVANATAEMADMLGSLERSLASLEPDTDQK